MAIAQQKKKKVAAQKQFELRTYGSKGQLQAIHYRGSEKRCNALKAMFKSARLYSA